MSLVEVKNGVAPLQISLKFSLKVEHIFAMQLSNSAARYVPERNENIWLHEELHAWVAMRSLFIEPDIPSEMEITQMPINWQVDKLNIIYPCNGITFSNKSELLLYARI